MSDQTPSHKSDIEQLAAEAAEKLNLDIDYLRDISPEEIKYLLDMCPFIQMVNMPVDPKLSADFHMIKSVSGWDIHSYGDAMSSSPGRFILGGGYYTWSADDEEQGGGAGNIVNPGKGTIVNQAFMTAAEMVDIAVSKQWTMIQLIDGHPLMMRSAWIRAGQLGIEIDGFTPDPYDEEIRDRLSLSSTDFELLRHKVKQQQLTP